VVSLYGSTNTLHNEPCALEDGKTLGDDICFAQILNFGLGNTEDVRLNICCERVRSLSQVVSSQTEVHRMCEKENSKHDDLHRDLAM